MLGFRADAAAVARAHRLLIRVGIGLSPNAPMNMKPLHKNAKYGFKTPQECLN
jgi:hypothetical protein